MRTNRPPTGRFAWPRGVGPHCASNPRGNVSEAAKAKALSGERMRLVRPMMRGDGVGERLKRPI